MTTFVELPRAAGGHALQSAHRWLKDAWERTAAAAVLLVLAPALIVLVLLVRLDSPGAPVFRQIRVGKDGRRFVMLKLRTMADDAEQRLESLLALDEGDGVLFKLREDPRVTRVGRVLRRFSLDELPQLVNVVLGHMALVGPRPPLPAEVDAYEQDLHRRLSVKPGMTGLWQVSGRSDLCRSEAVRLDLAYVDTWSLWLDLRILARTARAVLTGRGAY